MAYLCGVLCLCDDVKNNFDYRIGNPIKCEHLINLPKHIIIGLLHKGRNIIKQKKQKHQYIIVDEFNKKVILTRELNETCSTMAIYQVFQNPKRETYIICVNFKQPSLELLPNTAHMGIDTPILVRLGFI